LDKRDGLLFAFDTKKFELIESIEGEYVNMSSGEEYPHRF